MDPFTLIAAGGGLLKGLGALFGGNEERKTAQRNENMINAFSTEGNSLIDQGDSAARGYLNQALASYSPLASLGTKSGQIYADSLGINGADGNARATSAFQAGPGYQFTLDQGLQALERRGAAQGRLQSGQTGLDTLNYATGLADQTYGAWQDRLANPGILQTGLAGQAGALGSLADLSTGTAGQKLNLAAEILNGRMGANNQKGSATSKMIQGGLSGLSSAAGSLAGGWGYQ